jgi:hypothetical protein
MHVAFQEATHHWRHVSSTVASSLALRRENTASSRSVPSGQPCRPRSPEGGIASAIGLLCCAVLAGELKILDW